MSAPCPPSVPLPIVVPCRNPGICFQEELGVGFVWSGPRRKTSWKRSPSARVQSQWGGDPASSTDGVLGGRSPGQWVHQAWGQGQHLMGEAVSQGQSDGSGHGG